MPKGIHRLSKAKTKTTSNRKKAPIRNKPPPLIRPRSPAQAEYMQVLRDQDPCIVFATGPAGSGKTQLAASVGVEKLVKGEVSRLVVTRPAVSVEEQHGFLPGSLDEKMRPWVRPILDALELYYTPLEITTMLQNRVLELAPLAFMRGRTFADAYILCDEAQNCTPEQMLMMLTRIGKGSKLVITGDLRQHDRGYGANGLQDVLARFHDSVYEEDTIAHIAFDDTDVVRHPVIPFILSLYSE